jgi:hypothetical protein
MPRFFVVANSCAAPFFSDTSTEFVSGKTPWHAMENFKDSYDHPAGLYGANLYKDANAYHGGDKPLIRFISDKAKKDRNK